MKVIITSGGTEENIDAVRKITNMSSGKLGAKIAEKLCSENIEVIYISPKNAKKPINKENIRFVEANSAKEVESATKDILSSCKIHFFIHAMAVSDYYVQSVISLESLSEKIAMKTKSEIKDILKNTEIDLTSKKVSSSEENMFLGLKRNPKIIDVVKKISPEIKLIGFKLLNGCTKKELMDAAKMQMEKSHSDYVLANDLEDLKKGVHKAYLWDVYFHESVLEGKEQIAEEIKRIVQGGKIE